MSNISEKFVEKNRKTRFRFVNFFSPKFVPFLR